MYNIAGSTCPYQRISKVYSTITCSTLIYHSPSKFPAREARWIHPNLRHQNSACFIDSQWMKGQAIFVLSWKMSSVYFQLSLLNMIRKYQRYESFIIIVNIIHLRCYPLMNLYWNIQAPKTLTSQQDTGAIPWCPNKLDEVRPRKGLPYSRMISNKQGHCFDMDYILATCWKVSKVCSRNHFCINFGR